MYGRSQSTRLSCSWPWPTRGAYVRMDLYYKINRPVRTETRKRLFDLAYLFWASVGSWRPGGEACRLTGFLGCGCLGLLLRPCPASSSPLASLAFVVEAAKRPGALGGHVVGPRVGWW